MHTVFALLCFVVVIHWLIYPYPSGLLHWHCGNLTIAPVPAKQPWWIWINTSIWIHYERLHNHNKAKHKKTVCIFLGIYCMRQRVGPALDPITPCRLFDAKPLPEVMLFCCQLNPQEQTSVKIGFKIQNASFMKNALENIVCEMAVIFRYFRSGLICPTYPTNMLMVRNLWCYVAFYGRISPI